MASISQRSTGVTTAVASARPSPPAHASQTAADTRRRSGCVLGNNKSYIICIKSLKLSNFNVVVCTGLFRLSEDRVGDICNACVLLVKRWKKLPHGSKKNWNHVSDVLLFFTYPNDSLLCYDELSPIIVPLA